MNNELEGIWKVALLGADIVVGKVLRKTVDNFVHGSHCPCQDSKPPE